MIIGIDPGFTGAIAFLHDGVLEVHNLPIKMVMRKKQINEKDFNRMITIVLDCADIKYAVIEDVHAMPKQGVVSTFSFGYNAGILLGVLAANHIKIIKVRPNVWKSALNLSRCKKDSIALAKKIFPDYKDYFRLMKHDGRAEAALIAHFAKKCL